MNKLLYSQSNINRSELALVPTPAARGAYHKPYPFSAYVDDIEQGLELAGLKIVQQEFELSNDRQAFFGALEVAPKEGDLITANEWRLLIGLRGSHNQRIPRGLTLGSQIMVCSNLCFSGSIGTINTKQTLNMSERLPTLINDALARVPELAQLQDKKFGAYKKLELTSQLGDSALVSLYRKGAMNSAQLARAICEWSKPSYEEHKQYDTNGKVWSGWRLFNAVTESQKPTGSVVNTDTIRQRTEVLTDFMDQWSNEAGLL